MAKNSKEIKVSIINDKVSDAKAILAVIRLLKSIDINSTEAKLNRDSISDKNGGRILL